MQNLLKMRSWWCDNYVTSWWENYVHVQSEELACELKLLRVRLVLGYERKTQKAESCEFHSRHVTIS